jgi:hypothetical protein
VAVLGGILVVAVVVVAFVALSGGNGDSAITSACKAETSALRKAEDSYEHMTQQYGDITELQVAGFAKAPVYHEVLRPAGANYIIRVKDARCGVPGNSVGQTATDY